jgi:hypothetical protein
VKIEIMSHFSSLRASAPTHPALLYAVAGVILIVAALCGYTLGESWPLGR